MKWRGRVAGGAVFADHWAAPVTLVVGADLTQTEGFEESVKNMLKKERSRFTVQPVVGYGEKGNADLKVPPNATLEYEIELIDFEKVRVFACLCVCVHCMCSPAICMCRAKSRGI